MRQRRNRYSAGYTLMEMLIVVAIVGILSLVTVPAFMNFQRANILKTAMRTLAGDARAARALAIQQGFDVRVELTTGGPGSKQYRFYSSRDNGTTWAPVAVRGAALKTLDGPVFIASGSNLPDTGSNSKPDLIFHPSGAVDITAGQQSGEALLRVNFTNLAIDRYRILFFPSGNLKTLAGAQCRDGFDNDADGRIDFPADPQCSSANDDNESA